MKLLNLSSVLTILAISTSAFASDPVVTLKVTSLSAKAESIEFKDQKFVRSTEAFKTRKDADAFCKSHSAQLAESIDVLVIGILNGTDGKEKYESLVGASNLEVTHPSGEKIGGFISWLSDTEVKEVNSESDIMIIENGRGLEGQMTTINEVQKVAKENGVTVNKTELVAFCAVK